MCEFFQAICESIKSFVQFCNDNSGFTSAILAIVAIICTVNIGRLPYQKKISFYHYNNHDEKSKDIIVNVYVSNVGNCPLYIDRLIAKEGCFKEIGRCYEAETTILSERRLLPFETKEFKIHLNDYKYTSQRKRGALWIVLKSGNEKFIHKANWAMG